MDKKVLEKLDEIDESLSHQNILLSEIKEVLTDFKWFPLYLVGGIFGWLIVEKVWNFFFGY